MPTGKPVGVFMDSQPCKHGHDLSVVGVYLKTNGQVVCRRCQIGYTKKWYRKTYRLADKKTHCRKGHRYTVENTRTDGRGSRCCRACHAVRNKKAKLKYYDQIRASARKKYRAKIIEGLSQELIPARLAVCELRAAIRQSVSKQKVEI